jgi:peptide deformylase
MHFFSPVTLSPALLNTPSSILRQKCAPVRFGEWTTEQLLDIIRELFWLQHSLKGVGIAAPQVGLGLRLTAIDAGVGPPLALINPTITARAPEIERRREACLSIPGYYGMVDRPAGVTVEAFDAAGQPFTLETDGLLARVIQHEVDHLDGILYPDHLPSLDALLPMDPETLADRAMSDLYAPA